MFFTFLSAADGAMVDYSGYALIAMVVVMVAILFFSSRRDKKREKEQTEKRNSVEIGDEIITIGGIIGRVVVIKEDTIVLETGGDRSRIRFLRSAISEVHKLDLDGSKATAAAVPAADTGKKTRAERRAEKKAAEKE